MAKASKPRAPKAAVSANGEAGAAVAEQRRRRTFGAGLGGRSVAGKQLVIVESPSKAKTINKYLGSGYVVLASVGHVRDLPSRNPKGVKSPVPGVDLEHRFAPTYEVLPGKARNIGELKRAAKQASDVWFATDLDREGEAIAWHLAEELGIKPAQAKRVIFAAITKEDIQDAFAKPHPIDMDRVNAQQARRILDRIVGYQVSPMLWKKVARGLSAGRVQSVAVRLIVDREREIRAFVPEEYWQITANFTPEMAKGASLAAAWSAALGQRDEKGNPPTQKSLNSWLAEHSAFRAELVEVGGVGGEKFELRTGEANGGEALAKRAESIAQAAGLRNIKSQVAEDEKGKGPARWVRTVSGDVDPTTPYKVTLIETKRTSTRPSPPFITSTLQQAASSRLGFAAKRTMRAAQQLYEGVDLPGEGPVGLITYMRTDSTHLSGHALDMARGYIGQKFGDKYLPEKPNFFSSSNKDAQEAHEAIRPTNVEYTPSRVRSALAPDQFRLYSLVWERFVACQMTPAQWDQTSATIVGGRRATDRATDRGSERSVRTAGVDPARPAAPTGEAPVGGTLTFRATGRVLAFDGFYKVTGVPTASDEQNLPKIAEQTPLAPFAVEPRQRFTAPPPRYSEASLIKTLEAEGIGRPSTYASIIQVIQDRKYVEQADRRFFATDLGEVVTDKLIEAFPQIMDVGYTREMELELDKVEDDHIDWIQMLERFYGPFKDQLDHAMENLGHAKAETTPAPKEYRCGKCSSDLVYRFGKNGRFLSCSRYPECDYASPVDREGVPRPAAETVNVACTKCGSPMTKRTGRFGVFLGCARYGDKENPCDGILNLDKKGKVKAPSPPALITDLLCGTCNSPLNLRHGIRGPWLGCSRYPKCKGRGKWTELPEAKRLELEAQLEAHTKANPSVIIRTLDGHPLTDPHGKPLADAPMIEGLVTGNGNAPAPTGEDDTRGEEVEAAA